MKKVFIVYRNNYYRYLSTIIEACLDQNDRIEIWFHNSLDRKDSPFFKNINNNLKFVEFLDDKDLIGQIKRSSQVDNFFSLHPFPGDLDKEISLKIDNKWMIIMHGIDSYLEIRDWHFKHQNSFLAQDYRRHFFAYSNYLHQKGINWLENFKLDNSGNNCNFFSSEKTSTHFSKAPFIGMKSFKLDPIQIKKKYSLDPNKKVLVYLPFPYSSGRYEKAESNAVHVAFSGIKHKWEDNIYYLNKYGVTRPLLSLLKRIYDFLLIFRFNKSRKIHFNKQNEESVIKEIRNFCNKNNFMFVVKARKKLGFPRILDSLADLIVLGDENVQHPSEYQELSAVSDLTIGYTSTAVIESVFYKTHFINIGFPKEFYGYGDHSREMHNTRQGFLYNQPGVVTNFLYTDFIKTFVTLNPSLFNLNKESEKEYIKRFIGEDFLFDNRNYFRRITEESR